jgi:anti-sigma regulatory factor (Ser/Thr protein kinase)
LSLTKGKGKDTMIYKIKINSTFEEVDSAADQVIEYLVNRNYLNDGHSTFLVNFALRELLTNAVEHGNKMVREKEVTCLVSCSSSELKIDIFDEGEGFILKRYKSFESYEEILSSRGRGIPAIKRMGFDINIDRNHVAAMLSLQKRCEL